MKSLYTLNAIILITLLSIVAFAADPGRTDVVIMDSLTAKAGQSTIMPVKILADDTTETGGSQWVGIGTMCIPLKYDLKVFKVDSVKFVGTLAKWDEKFTNLKIDTGFVSLNGIHDVGGQNNPMLFAPKEPEEVAKIFLTIKKDAPLGTSEFVITKDPIQGEFYLASGDGLTSWKPKIIAGKVTVIK
jgi:hypothetical protein